MKNDNAYARLAPWYEYLCDDCDYENWSQYFVCLLTEKIGDLSGKKGLDLGCGSGVFTRFFAKNGARMTGLDLSLEMLSVAEEKARAEGLNITYMQSDVGKFKTFDKFDFVCAANDVLNYLPKKRLLSALKSAASALKKGGAFVFDVSSPLKYATKIDGKISADDRDEVTYLSFGKVEGDVATLDVTLFIKREDGAFDRFDELHTQYVYEEAEIIEALKAAGLTLACVTGFCGEDKASSDRLFFLAVKEK